MTLAKLVDLVDHASDTRIIGGEGDVQVQGKPPEAHARMEVKRIDGLIMFVILLEDERADTGQAT